MNQTRVSEGQNSVLYGKVWVNSSGGKQTAPCDQAGLRKQSGHRTYSQRPWSNQQLGMCWNLGGSSLVTLKGQCGGGGDGPCAIYPAAVTRCPRRGLGAPGPGGKVTLRQQHLCPPQVPLNQEAPSPQPLPAPWSLKFGIPTQRAHVLWKHTDLCSDPSGASFQWCHFPAVMLLKPVDLSKLECLRLCGDTVTSNSQRTWNNLGPNSLSCLHHLLSLVALQFPSLSRGPCYPQTRGQVCGSFLSLCSEWLSVGVHRESLPFTLAANRPHKAPEATSTAQGISPGATSHPLLQTF